MTHGPRRPLCIACHKHCPSAHEPQLKPLVGCAGLYPWSHAGTGAGHARGDPMCSAPSLACPATESCPGGVWLRPAPAHQAAAREPPAPLQACPPMATRWWHGRWPLPASSSCTESSASPSPSSPPPHRRAAGPTRGQRATGLRSRGCADAPFRFSLAAALGVREDTGRNRLRLPPQASR